MSLKPVIRISMVILGVVLVIGAFAAVLTLGIGTNPPPLRIAVIQRDVIPGEHLKQGDFRIVEQIIDPRLAALYVQEHELPRYLGAFVIDPLRRGDPLSKVKLAAGDGEIALRRYSLVLTDANDVIMTLPVNPDVIPARISPGDFVNILFAGGAETGLQQLPLDATPSAPPPLDAMLIPTPTHFIEFSLPMADVMLEHVPILDINYQATQGSRFGNGTAANDVAVGNGPISSIVVKVPRSHQSLLMFGATVSKLRFAISSPIFNASKSAPELAWIGPATSIFTVGNKPKCSLVVKRLLTRCIQRTPHNRARAFVKFRRFVRFIRFVLCPNFLNFKNLQNLTNKNSKCYRLQTNRYPISV